MHGDPPENLNLAVIWFDKSERPALAFSPRPMTSMSSTYPKNAIKYGEVPPCEFFFFICCECWIS